MSARRDLRKRAVVNTAHGLAAYKRGCRCDICREAKADKQAALRARRANAPLPADDPRHGRVNTYLNWACRCLQCVQAKIAADALRRNGSAVAS